MNNNNPFSSFGIRCFYEILVLKFKTKTSKLKNIKPVFELVNNKWLHRL